MVGHFILDLLWLILLQSSEESIHVCNKGYLSLFPFLLGLLPSSSPHLGPILDLLSDPLHLWSPYGLRSLSASHPLFGQGENYWRGPIWIQMNYLALSSLYKVPYSFSCVGCYLRADRYMQQNLDHIRRGPARYTMTYERTLYAMFSRRVRLYLAWLDLIVGQEYERTGYVWEQYDPMTGEGRRSHPFTGWTSLVTLSALFYIAVFSLLTVSYSYF